MAALAYHVWMPTDQTYVRDNLVVGEKMLVRTGNNHNDDDKWFPAVYRGQDRWEYHDEYGQGACRATWIMRIGPTSE